MLLRLFYNKRFITIDVWYGSMKGSEKEISSIQAPSLAAGGTNS